MTFMTLKKICTAMALTLAVSASLPAATINVFLLGGQSNMDGRARVSEIPSASASLLNQQDVIFYSNSVNNKITYLQPRTDNQYGPELSFGRSMADFYAGAGEQVALIKYAVGGTNLYEQWAADGTASSAADGQYYKSFQSTVTAGLNALRAAHPNDTIVIQGMIWMQGESDANNGVNDSSGGLQSLSYGTNLANFIADVRLTLDIADLPFVIGKLSTQQLGTGKEAYRNNVRAGQEAVAAADPFASLVYTDTFAIRWDDSQHFGYNNGVDGQLQLGGAFALEMQKYLAIPEPSTWALMLSGAALLLMLRRKR